MENVNDAAIDTDQLQPTSVIKIRPFPLRLQNFPTLGKNSYLLLYDHMLYAEV